MRYEWRNKAKNAIFVSKKLIFNELVIAVKVMNYKDADVYNSMKNNLLPEKNGGNCNLNDNLP